MKGMLNAWSNGNSPSNRRRGSKPLAISFLVCLVIKTCPIMKGDDQMKLEFDGKSLFVGVIVGWLATVFRASVAVAREKIAKKEKEV